MCISENISHRSLKKPRRRNSLPAIYCGIRILTFLGGTSSYKIVHPTPTASRNIENKKKKQSEKQL